MYLLFMYESIVVLVVYMDHWLSMWIFVYVDYCLCGSMFMWIIVYVDHCLCGAMSMWIIVYVDPCLCGS